MAFLTPDPRHLDRSDRPTIARETTLGGEALYRAWDGSQDVADLTADDIVDALSEDLLEHGDLAEALRDLMDRGVRSSDPSRGDLRGRTERMARLDAAIAMAEFVGDTAGIGAGPKWRPRASDAPD